MRYWLMLAILLVPLAHAATTSNAYVQPSSALCSDSGDPGNWASGVCAGTYTQNDDACSDALVSCDDTNAESFSNTRGNVMGVDVRVADTTVDPAAGCDSILGVRVEYRYTTTNNPGTQTLEVSGDDGANWQAACGGTPGTEGVTNTCDVSAATTWTCDDFFGTAPQARTRIYASNSGGNPQQTYGITTNYLVYYVDYNYTTTPLEADKAVYEQSGTLTLTGQDVWDANTDVTINLTRSALVDQLNVTTNSTGGFTTTYDIGDYAPTGTWTAYAYQQNDSSINGSTTFDVNQRTPTITTARDGILYNRTEVISMTGQSFAKNATVLISASGPDGSLSTPSSVQTNTTGGFSYNYQFGGLTSTLGNYEFTYQEQANTTYNDTQPARLAVLVRAANRTTDLQDLLTEIYTNNSVYARVVATAGQEDAIDFAHYRSVPAGASIDAISVGFRHTEPATSPGAFLKWYNTTSGAYQTACSYAPRSTPATDTCDLSSLVTTPAQANNLRLRVSDDAQTSGGSTSHNYDVDVAYVDAQFSLPPEISNVSHNTTPTSATISWQTNNSANATVRYGETQSFGNEQSNTSLSTNHEFTLAGLSDDTTYYYNVTSCTAYECETQGPFSFTTPKLQAPQISSVTESVNASAANISWQTSKQANASIRYGTSTSYGTRLTNTTQNTTHSFSLSSLEAARTYYYEIQSCDALGCSQHQGQFKTAPPLAACKHRYLETAPDHEPGLVKDGDVVVFDCRLQAPVYEQQDLQVQAAWPSLLLTKTVTTPRLLFGDQEVLYP